MTDPRHAIERAVFQCDGTLVLRDGTLTIATADALGATPTTTLAVTGGSGAYEGARGSITSRGDSNSENAVDTVHLLP